ncbi:RWD domain-containing protein 4-like [Limulus polyphemus]|uniref:RWD domain-containing protein 4-like n=1 Tax=Limulus polyphemus TaxID=6850 RepID=A0ABM1BDX8_LIMPO|nr:RWD domain-containing protein 4-like [Limulus polyphemus]
MYSTLCLSTGSECFSLLKKECLSSVTEHGENRSYLLEISWSENYPNSKPDVNLDAFYNKYLKPEVKTEIVSKVLEEAEQLLGMPMTYTLLEWAKENSEKLLENQPEQSTATEDSLSTKDTNVHTVPEPEGAVSKKKKPQLTKQQKRKMFDRLDAKGEKPRGWDWVDIVKHLSQTGGSKSNTTESSNS